MAVLPRATPATVPSPPSLNRPHLTVAIECSPVTLSPICVSLKFASPHSAPAFLSAGVRRSIAHSPVNGCSAEAELTTSRNAHSNDRDPPGFICGLTSALPAVLDAGANVKCACTIRQLVRLHRTCSFRTGVPQRPAYQTGRTASTPHRVPARRQRIVVRRSGASRVSRQACGSHRPSGCHSCALVLQGRHRRVLRQLIGHAMLHP
jgi:hypothetical protein